MRKFVLFFLFLCSLGVFAESITNVRATQEGNNIVLLYDLNSNQRVKQVNILFNGRHRVIPQHCLFGDINKIVVAGVNRRIVYDVLKDYTDGLSAEVEFVIFTESDFLDDSKDVEAKHAKKGVEKVVTHRMVDMGLSVKWAAYNVGANTPLSVGDYFAWGETSSKSSYSDNNYNINNFIDAVTELWGGAWRMPTVSEWNELKENCIWKWGALEGVYGYKITSKKNGNSIFLPATGYKENSVVSEKNSCGYYWLNMINPNNINQARSLYIDATKVGVVNCICYTGRCLRAVCP